MGTNQKMSGKRSNYYFPLYLQQHDNTCGPACFAMIAEWATGLPQSESEWGLKLKMNENGVTSARLDKAFKISSNNRPVEVVLAQSKEKNIAISIEKLFSSNNNLNALKIRSNISEESIYLALIDSFTIDAENPQHWIVIVGVKKYKGRNIVIYADPLETRLQAWDWESLKAAKLCALYNVRRIER